MKEFEAFFLKMEPQGPFKLQILLDFMLKKTNSGIQFLVDHLLEEHRKFASEKEQVIDKTQLALKQAVQKQEDTERQLLEQQKTMNSDREEFEERIQLLETQVLEERKESSLGRQKLQSELEQKLTLLVEEKQQLLDQFKSLTEELKLKAEEYKILKSESEKETALCNQKQQFFEENITSLRSQEEELRKELQNQKEQM